MGTGIHFGLDAINRSLNELIRLAEDEPRRRHEAFLKHLNLKADITRHAVIHDIRMMFAKAFPNRYYVFLVQRPCDVRGNQPPWPVVFTDPDRASNYEDRVSPVVEVLL